jgi:hypothetical protein
MALGSAYSVETAQRLAVGCSGTITGVWWYRTSSDSGTITVSIWRNGLLVGSGAGDPAPGPGWRFLALSTALRVGVGENLLVGVHHPNGSYGATVNGLTSRGPRSASGCLTVPASSASNHNGLYLYTAVPAMPGDVSSYADSEYFISPNLVADTVMRVAVSSAAPAPSATPRGPAPVAGVGP